MNNCPKCKQNIEECEACYIEPLGEEETNKLLAKYGFYEDGPNLENQVEVRQALIEEQKEMISILSRDLARICHDSYELLLLASIPASHSKEVYEHLESCAAVISKLTEQRNDEVMEALDVSED